MPSFSHAPAGSSGARTDYSLTYSRTSAKWKHAAFIARELVRASTPISFMLRQGKLGKEEARWGAKTLNGAQRVRSPCSKGWPPAASESCVVTPRGVLRSVDSER